MDSVTNRSQTQPDAARAGFVNMAVSKIVLAYAGFAALWILLSDQAVLLVTSDPQQIAVISTIKGWIFVAVTSCLLALVVRRYLRQLALVAQQLRASEETWKFALEGAGDGVWDWNIQTGAAKFSRRWKEMLGYAHDEIGQTADEWATRVHPDDKARVMADIQTHIDDRTPSVSSEFRMQCKDGNWKWIHGRGMVVSRDAAGKPLRLVGTNTDIGERKLLEAELQLQARVDYLTGVTNRGHFMQRAEQEFQRALRTGKPPSVLMLDIDWFKQVNDTHGHDVGDSVLKKLAQVCRQTLREVDTIGRMGGEEFAILLPETGLAEAAEAAERLRTMISAAHVVTERGQTIQFTVSIGVASVVSSDDPIGVVLGQADKALYEAKNAGRNRVCVAAQ